MSENVLETVRATVQDFLAPEIRTHGVRLDNIERRIDELRQSLEHRIDDTKETLRAELRTTGARIDDTRQSLEHRIDDAKETLRAEMRTMDARLGGQIGVLEGLIRQLIQQVTVESSLRERVASIEARLPKQ